MEYNTIENINSIKSLLRIIVGDAKQAEANTKYEATKEELETLYRAIEVIEDYAEQARIALGKLMDEREDSEWTQF